MDGACASGLRKAYPAASRSVEPAGRYALGSGLRRSPIRTPVGLALRLLISFLLRLFYGTSNGMICVVV